MKTALNNVERNLDNEIEFNTSMIQTDTVKLKKKEDLSKNKILKSFEYGGYCVVQLTLNNHIEIYVVKGKLSEINLFRMKPIAEFQHMNNGWSDAILYLFKIIDNAKGV